MGLFSKSSDVEKYLNSNCEDVARSEMNVLGQRGVCIPLLMALHVSQCETFITYLSYSQIFICFHARSDN